MKKVFLLLALFCVFTPSARASDLRRFNLTVLPVTTAVLYVDQDQTRISGSVVPSTGGAFRLRFDVSGPIKSDEDKKPYVGTVYWGYNSAWDALERKPTDLNRADFEYCEAHKIHPCTESNLPYRRDMYGVPSAMEDFLWEAGIELGGSYSEVKAYPVDIAKSADDFTRYSVQPGINATGYIPANWALNFRTGLDYKQTVDTREFERCFAEESSNERVTGRSCKKALVAPDGEQTSQAVYSRFAAMYVHRSAIVKGYLPGAEARFNFEDLFTPDRHLNVRITAFVAPETGPFLLQTGVGMETNVKLPNAQKPDTDYTPFVFTGATFL